MGEPFSVVIITKNEAHNIVRCLEALAGLSDDVLVVDTGSTDETRDLAAQNGARVVQQPWLGYAATKNLGNHLARHNWILSIDADEVVSPELHAQLRDFRPAYHVAYALDRLTNYCGKWVRHSGWYPDWKPRLFSKRYAEWTGEFVHETLALAEGWSVMRLPGKLYHYSYRTDAEHLERMERYAQLGAEKMHAAGKRPNFVKQYLSPPARFFRTYFLKRGFLDGTLGLKIAWRNAVMVNRKYEILKWLWIADQKR